MENQNIVIRSSNAEFILEYDYFCDTNPNTSITYPSFLEKKLIKTLKELEEIKKKYDIKDNIKPSKNSKKVLQFNPGDELPMGEYSSISEAARLTGVDRISISKHIANPDERRHAGGYVWRVKE